MKNLKNNYKFAMRHLFIRIAKSIQSLLTNHKGIVPLNSFCSNTVSECRNLEGAMPYFINFYKFFTNATLSKQFIKCSTVCKRYVYFTKRNTNNFRFFKRFIALVQNHHQTQFCFHLLQTRKNFVLWQRHFFRRSLSQSYCQDYCITTF